MNILELCLSPSLGGLELYMYRAVKNLSGADNVISILCSDGRLKPYFERDDLEYVTEKSHFPPFPVLTAKRIAALIDARDIDVLHTHWGKDFPLAALAKKFSRRKPKLVYTRQMKMTRNKDDFYHRFLYRQMDMMLCITDQLAEEARQYLNAENTQKIQRLYYGVDTPSCVLSREERQDLRQTWEVDKGTFLVGLFGRIEENKRQRLLVEVIARAKKNNTAMKGLIVGRAMSLSDLNQLKSLVERQGLKQDIIFQDFVERPQDWMQACDCVILATAEETFGLVLIEAMRAGVAVAGTNRGGVPEIVDHAKTGLLFEPDDITGLYESLLLLKNDAPFREKLAAAGRKKADQLFDTDLHFRELRRLMKEGWV
ncbi:MAG: glycosyltransferase family 4 protein [Nitrospiria bacterium]